MEISIFEIDADKHSTSNIIILNINCWSLFEMDWCWADKNILYLKILGIKIK